MKITKQSVVVLDCASQSPAMNIEAAARTCYKSEDRITEGSAETLLAALIKRKHFPMLEFAHLALCIRDHNLHFHLSKAMASGKFLGLRMTSNYDVVEPRVENFGRKDIADEFTKLPRFVISGSIRAMMQLLVGAREFARNDNDHKLITRAERYLGSECGFLKIVDAYDPGWLMSAATIIARDGAFEPISLLNHDPRTWEQCSDEEIRAHTYAVLRFITDRGVTHEMVRHRVCGFAQESTRYVKYDDAEFILPVWCNDEMMRVHNEGGNLEELTAPIADVMWLHNCTTSECGYGDLAAQKWQAQQARTVLNNSLKTEIVVAANLEEWGHIINMRSIGVSGPPHPQMQDLARKAHILLSEKYGEFVPAVPADGLVLQRNTDKDSLTIQAAYI